MTGPSANRALRLLVLPFAATHVHVSRDNFPSTAGEIGGTGQPRGKISCIDQRVTIPGLQLPVH